ncbi:hypothetical protein ACDF64_10475 [Agromyces sp. MMS24-JH15]|uniref:hypothetical protein n=1 Tax=Agromyces sp. MMS24-JH15 TaxID=3243765 RepID=UPI003748E8B3
MLSILVGFVLQAIWSLFILMPQWKLVGGEPDPAYLTQHDVGTALFSGVAILIAVAASSFGSRSISEAGPVERGRPGRAAAIARGWIGIVLAALGGLYAMTTMSSLW